MNGFAEIRNELSATYPDSWALGLIKVCSATRAHTHKKGGDTLTCQSGKSALEKGWNTSALERYESGDREAHLDTAAAWMVSGYNVGLCPPPNIVIVDCDNAAAVRFFGALAGPLTPRQQRTDASAHFVWQMPEQLKSKTGCVFTSSDGEEVRFDLRVGGRGFVVCAPSLHTSGVHTRWVVPLPSDVNATPVLPDLAREVMRQQNCLEHDFAPPETRATGEMPGHDQLRQRIARAASRYRSLPELRAAATPWAERIYADRPGRLSAVLAQGGECDRLCESAFEQWGGTHPLDIEMTDQGRALGHVTQFGDTVYWVDPLRRFLKFSGVIWEEASPKVISHDFTVLQDRLFEDAAWAPAGAQRDALTAQSRALRSARTIASAVQQLGNLRQARLDSFDAHPDLWVFPNGFVGDLRAQQLTRVTPELRITRMGGADYVRGARSSLWEEFVDRALGGGAEAAFVQRLIGMTMLGANKDHVIPFLYGPAGTGKSTFTFVMLKLFGGYGVQGSFGSIVASKRQAGAASPDLASWRGRRIVILDEIGEGQRLDAVAKSLSGDAQISVRGLYQDQIEIPVTWTMLGQGNKEPECDPNDPGLRRRIIEIPFETPLVKPVGAEDLKVILTSRVGIEGAMQWALEGNRAYQREGLGTTPRIEAAKSRYWEGQDVVAGWTNTECTVARGEVSDREDLWRSFDSWQMSNLTPRERLTRVAFFGRLKLRWGAPVLRKKHGTRVYYHEGISLLGAVGAVECPTQVPGVIH